MKQQVRRWRRVVILILLSLSVVAPLIFLSVRLAKLSSSLDDEVEFANDIAGIRHSSDALRLKSVELDEEEEVEEPVRIILKERANRPPAVTRNSSAVILGVTGGEHGGLVADGSSGRSGTHNDTGGGGVIKKESVPARTVEQDNGSQITKEEHNRSSSPHRATDEKIREMKDQLIMAKAYLLAAPPKSNSHLSRELRLRIKEIERVIGHAHKDSDLSKSALQRKRVMEISLAKASKVYPDCSTIITKLRAMAYSTEEQLKAQRNQASYLLQLAERTFPKGLHCLSLRLTAEYFALPPEGRVLPNRESVGMPEFYHYAIFSDNVLACAVVVNSTVSTSKEPQNIVFHIVTDAVNYPALKMWFLMNPPNKATIHIENLDDFGWFSSNDSSTVKQHGVKDARFNSVLNHLRFYLPKIYPYLDKVLFLDHDVVVQRDLSGLWKTKMKGKVIAAVERCREGESFGWLETLVNFSDPHVAKSFDPKACVWAFGMNMFDLREWRMQGLMTMHHRWLQLAMRKQVVKAGTLPLGQVVFYNHTVPLDRRWHVLGLGYDPSIGQGEIERAAVIHYDGNMKPWLEIGIPKYKGYWNRFLNYGNQYLQQCNIHE